MWAEADQNTTDVTTEHADEELAEVGVIAGHTARWSAMIHALYYDYDTFVDEFEQIGAHLQQQQAAD